MKVTQVLINDDGHDIPVKVGNVKVIAAFVDLIVVIVDLERTAAQNKKNCSWVTTNHLASYVIVYLSMSELTLTLQGNTARKSFLIAIHIQSGARRTCNQDPKLVLYIL